MYLNSRNDNIDILRGLAALIVAYFHAREITWIGMSAAWVKFGVDFSPSILFGYLTAPFVWGSIGVPIFFVLSGYCIHRGNAYKLKKDSLYKIDLYKYLTRRFIRIYPLLLAALLLTFLLDSYSSTYAPDHYKLGNLSFDFFLGNLFATQGVLTDTYGSNIALWTLAIEIQLYIFYIVIFSLRKKIGIAPTAVIVVLINLISVLYVDVTFFTSFLFSWCLGAYIAERELGAPIYYSEKKLLSISMLLLIVGCAMLTLKHWNVLSFSVLALSFSFFLIVFLDMRIKRNFLWVSIKEIGTFSYSLYIVHVPLIVFLDVLLLRGAKSPYVYVSFVCLVICISFAYLLYQCIERPSIKLMAKLNSNC